MNDHSLCPVCNREISKFAYSRHVRACENGKIKDKLPPSEKLPNGKTIRWMESMNARKGNGTNQYTKAIKLNLPKPIAVEVSNETRQKMSASAKTRSTSELRKNMSDHAKRRGLGGKFVNTKCEYNGHKFGSSYEVYVAKSLDSNSIRWIKPKKFDYIDPFNKSRQYTPDFYLPDFDVYLDPKNDFLINNINPSMGFSDCEKIKIVEQTHSIRVLILDKTMLTWDKIQEQIFNARVS
jgi:hypothetical protein